MTLISVEKDLCTKCGVCAVPCRIIYWKKGNYPRQLPNTDDFCMRCGYCIGLCPTGALKHAEMPPAETPLIDESLKISFEQCSQLIRARRSIREYKDTDVGKEEFERIIDVARYAPTGHNFQGVHWLVVNNREKVRKVAAIGADWLRGMAGENPQMAEMFSGIVKELDAGHDEFLHDAPSFVITCAQKENRIAATDCVIALSYFDLVANTAGLGCCWAGFLMMAAATYPPMINELKLPHELAPHGAMLVGYPAYPYVRIPARKPAKIIFQP